MTIRPRSTFTAALVLGSLALTSWAQPPGSERYWSQWRGPFANGVSKTANPPIEWSETKNLRWKLETPGRGSSSPVVWGDRVFILTAIPSDVNVADLHTPLVIASFESRGLFAYDRNGKSVGEG